MYTFSEDVSAFLAGVYLTSEGINALIFDDTSGQYADGAIFVLNEDPDLYEDQGFKIIITANRQWYVLCSIYFTQDTIRDGVTVTELMIIRP